MQTQIGLDYTSVFAVLSELVEIGLVVINSSGKIDFASDKARYLLGCGDDLRIDSCPPVVQQGLEEVIGDVSGGATSTTKEIRFDVDGERRELMLEGHPIDEDDCSGTLLLVKNAENMRNMAADLRLSAQFRNTRRLYQSVVQDLRQPITAVLVHADVLRDRLTGVEDEVDESDIPELKSLRVIKSQISDLNRTLTLLLEEFEPAETEERGLSLRDVLNDVARLIRPPAAQQNVEVKVNTVDHAARMNGSRQRIKQAILNTAVNALDAMPDGGTLELTLDVEDDRASIGVVDSGEGISHGVLPHIFEMHYTTKASGTGVGLYVAREVIERHGGSIEVDTEYGHGSTFRIRLPVSKNDS